MVLGEDHSYKKGVGLKSAPYVINLSLYKGSAFIINAMCNTLTWIIHLTGGVGI